LLYTETALPKLLADMLIFSENLYSGKKKFLQAKIVLGCRFAKLPAYRISASLKRKSQNAAPIGMKAG
jgi:hypothetical protein